MQYERLGNRTVFDQSACLRLTLNFTPRLGCPSLRYVLEEDAWLHCRSRYMCLSSCFSSLSVSMLIHSLELWQNPSLGVGGGLINNACIMLYICIGSGT